MQNCKCCRQKQQKLKVLQSDLDFQLKKMTEDLSNEKVLLELQYQKESKRIIQKYNKEKKEREEENKKWISKYDHTLSEFSEKLVATEKENNQKIALKESLLRGQSTKKEEKIIQRYTVMIKSKEQAYLQQLISLQSKNKDQKQQIEKQYQEQIRELKTLNQQQSSALIKKYNEKIQELKNQNQGLSESNKKIKLQASYRQTQLYQEIYDHKQNIATLKYQIDQANGHIQLLSREITQKEELILFKQKQYQKQVQMITKEFQQSKKTIISQCKQEIESLLKSTLRDCQKYESVLRVIDQKRQNEIKIYEDGLSEIKYIIEDRPSRQQDLKQINYLRDLLEQKDKDFHKAINEIKTYKLEMHNKEEVYNKIFNNHPLNIEKIGRKKETKVSKGSISLSKEGQRYSSTTTNLYSISNTHHALSNTHHNLSHTHSNTNTNLDLFIKKDRLVLQSKSNKVF